MAMRLWAGLLVVGGLSMVVAAAALGAVVPALVGGLGGFWAAIGLFAIEIDRGEHR